MRLGEDTSQSEVRVVVEGWGLDDVRQWPVQVAVAHRLCTGYALVQSRPMSTHAHNRHQTHTHTHTHTRTLNTKMHTPPNYKTKILQAAQHQLDKQMVCIYSEL